MEKLPINEEVSTNSPNTAPVVSGDASAAALNEVTYYKVLQSEGLEELSPILVDPRAKPDMSPKTQKEFDELKQQIQETQKQVERSLDNYERSGFIGKSIMSKGKPLYSQERLESIGQGRAMSGKPMGRGARRFSTIGSTRYSSRAEARHMKKLGKAQRKANNALLTSVMIKNGTSMAQEGVPTPSNIENLRKSGTISRSDAKEMRKRAGHGLLRSWAEKTGFTKKIYTQAENTKAGEIGKKIQNRGSNEQVQDRLTGRVTNNEEKNIKKLDKYIADRNALILQLGELIRKADESNPGLVLHALEKRAKAIEEARQARETRSSEVHTNGHYARRVVELDEDEDTEE